MAINELSDSNNALRAAHEATLRNHLLAEEVAEHLASSGPRNGWDDALAALVAGLADAVLVPADLAHDPGQFDDIEALSLAIAEAETLADRRTLADLERDARRAQGSLAHLTTMPVERERDHEDVAEVAVHQR